MLSQAGFGGEIGVDHFGSFGSHDARGGRAGFKDGEGAGGVEAAVAGEFEAFGQHGAMEPQDEVEDEFHAGTGARRAGVEELGADGEEDGFGAGEGGGVCSADHESFARGDLTAGATEGGVEVSDAAGGEGGGGGFDGGGVSGGGVDEHLHGAIQVCEHGGDFGRAGEAEQDAATRFGDRALGVQPDDSGWLCGWIRVVAVDRVSRCKQAGGEGGAGEAEAEEADRIRR